MTCTLNNQENSALSSGFICEKTAMSLPLQGRTIALAETRQLEELAQLLEKEGAVALRCPIVSILDAPDSVPVLTWVRQLCADPLAYVVLMTGEALRRLLSFAERDGLRDAFISSLARTKLITRGPKPGQVLREIGLTPSRVAESPTTDGVIATLRNEPLGGQTVGVTLYGELNPRLEQFLASVGATVRTVMPYVYAPAADEERVADLIARLARGEIDALVLTSSPQVDRLFKVAERRGLTEALRHGLANTRVAAIGPVLAENLKQRGTTVHICPEQGFVLKNLIQHIKRDLASGDV
jgi:uroporphyrinogen-III synthase